MPQNIVSEWDLQFTGSFLTELFKLLGLELNISPSYHPQTDGQIERFNVMLEEYLRHFVHDSMKIWVELLDVAQFCFNSKKSSSTNNSVFKLVMHQQPLLPHTLQEVYKGKNPQAFYFTKEWKANVEIAQSYLESAGADEKEGRSRPQASRVPRWRHSARQATPITAQVPSLQQQEIVLKIRMSSLRRSKVGNCSYKVDIPAWMKVHLSFMSATSNHTS